VCDVSCLFVDDVGDFLTQSRHTGTLGVRGGVGGGDKGGEKN